MNLQLGFANPGDWPGGYFPVFTVHLFPEGWMEGRKSDLLIERPAVRRGEGSNRSGLADGRSELSTVG